MCRAPIRSPRYGNFGGYFDAGAPVVLPVVPTPPIALPPAGPITTAKPGKITQYPLPASTGSTFGVSLYGAPFRSNGVSKQCDMCYCPDNGRIYVQDGDTVVSAADGTWSVNSATPNDWRLEVGQPVYPTLPAPRALQDDFGFWWVAKKKKFLLWPGSYFPYPQPFDPVANPTQHYSMGMWWFDPVMKTYTQELGLFGTYGQTTGNPFGGVYDEQNDHIVVLGDSSGGYKCMRWDVANLVRLPDLAYAIAAPATNPAAKATYFTQTGNALLGRDMYAVGYATDGTALRIPRAFRWNLDAHTMTEIAPPPAPAVMLESRLNVSHGKVVWLNFTGPDGADSSVLIYDPATNAWAQDTQPLPAGFMGNVTCTLPDGRVALAGGVFGKQQTMFNFYEAA